MILWAFSYSVGPQCVCEPSVNLSALSESVELSKSLWAFGETVDSGPVCEFSASLWDLSQPVGLQCICTALCESEGPKQQ